MAIKNDPKVPKNVDAKLRVNDYLNKRDVFAPTNVDKGADQYNKVDEQEQRVRHDLKTARAMNGVIRHSWTRSTLPADPADAGRYMIVKYGGDNCHTPEAAAEVLAAFGRCAEFNKLG